MADTHVHPRSTSWGSVLGGWLAALGTLAIVFPLTALALGLSSAVQERVDDPMLAVPLVIALFVSWLVGGYVAGRMAAYRRSWHGLMSAIWGLFVALVVALVAGGSAANLGNLTVSLPALDLSGFGNATVFGFVLGLVAVILGGWLGGVLAPAQVVHAPARIVERGPVPARRDTRREIVRERRATEPTAWDRFTGRSPDLEEGREREAAPLVPPAEPVRPESAAVREEESEARR